VKSTFRLLSLTLWDEDAKQLVRFKDVAALAAS
jgi:hypothetical protein